MYDTDLYMCRTSTVSRDVPVNSYIYTIYDLSDYTIDIYICRTSGGVEFPGPIYILMDYLIYDSSDYTIDIYICRTSSSVEFPGPIYILMDYLIFLK